AHKEDRWKGTLNTGVWFSVTDATGANKDVLNAEIYATHRENQLRSEFGLPLRTHYSPDAAGGVYEPSRIIKSGTSQSIYYDNNGNSTFKRLSRSQTPFTYQKH